METIEIRQNKKSVVLLLALLTMAFLGMTYFVFFSGKVDNSNTMIFLHVLLTASLIYSIYFPARKVFRNEPVLTFSKYEIEINDKGKPVSFLWLQVIDWKIEKEEDGGTHYLTIETADKKRKINISWLDKRPNEIKELLQRYMAS